MKFSQEVSKDPTSVAWLDDGPLTATDNAQHLFDDFYRTHRLLIARALSLVLNDPDLGFEAADEAMSRAYKNWDQVQFYKNPEGWVFRVGLNWARSLLRRARIGRTKFGLVADRSAEADELPDADLRRAIETLSQDHRSVVVLRFYADWKIDRIAEGLDLPSGTVKSRLSRALATLEQALNQAKDDQ